MSAARASLEDPETLTQFVRRLSEGVYITSREGRILAGNPALYEILGLDGSDSLETIDVPALWCHPGERERQARILAERGAVREFEVEIRRRDGTLRTVLDTCYQVLDPASGEVRYHGILVDITERKRLERQLFESSRRDALTGSLNRRFLAELAARFERTPTPWGVVLVDIDGFKAYNDRYGHAVGDEVLRRVATFLDGEVRGEDHVVRLGGDEFLVVMVGRDAERTAEVARRIERGGRLGVALSVGWGVREAGEPLERTISRADRALLAGRSAKRGSPG